MESGFLNVLKPPGMTSSDVVLRVRRMLPRGVKTGHAGTLDPGAAGVLPVMVGKATRLFDWITEKQKTYVAELVPGLATDTLDVYGKEIRREPAVWDEAKLRAAMARWTGDVMQRPPAVSAIKRGGKRLYELARAGEAQEPEARPVRIESLRLLRVDSENSVWIEIICGRGTYIRSLCRDLGESMGIPACMGVLIRTASGPFRIEDAVTLETLAEADPRRYLLPMDLPLAHLPRLDFPEEARRYTENGNPVPLELAPCGAEEGETLRLYEEGAFCGIGRKQGGYVRFLAMLRE